jgi:hypothetical protein
MQCLEVSGASTTHIWVVRSQMVKNKILKEETDSKYRLCKQHEEIIDHITSGCPILAKNEYLMRHDKVCTHFHYSINMQSLKH